MSEQFHEVDGVKYLCYSDDHYCPSAQCLHGCQRAADEMSRLGQEMEQEGISGPCDCGEGAVHYTAEDCPFEQRLARGKKWETALTDALCEYLAKLPEALTLGEALTEAALVVANEEISEKQFVAEHNGEVIKYLDKENARLRAEMEREREWRKEMQRAVRGQRHRADNYAATIERVRAVLDKQRDAWLGDSVFAAAIRAALEGEGE